MHKLVYSVGSDRAARRAVAELLRAGVERTHIGLAARSDIELEKLPDRYAEETTDFNEGMKRGAALGGTVGVVAGLIAAAVPTLGITLVGAALIGAVGAAVGGWAGAVFGAALPSEVRRGYEDEVARGHVLVAVDVLDDAARATVERVMSTLDPSARRLPSPHGANDLGPPARRELPRAQSGG
jgi:hypothetical protein